MSPAAAARSILLTTSCVFLEPETVSCDSAGVSRHLADDRGAVLVTADARSRLVRELRNRLEVPAVALAIDVPRSTASRRPLPRLQLTGWLGLSMAPAWTSDDDVVLRLDPQIVVLVTDHGPVEVDLDEYQEVPHRLLRTRGAA
jgi:hypothetical protein